MDGDTDRLRGKQDSLLVCTDGPKAYVWKSVNALFFSNYLNLLMLCTPFAVLARQHGSDGVIFAFSLLAIAPFAERLSFVTEQLALHTNETKPPQGRRAALRAPQRATPASWVWHGWLRLAPRAYSSGQSPSEPKREAGGGASGPHHRGSEPSELPGLTVRPSAALEASRAASPCTSGYFLACSRLGGLLNATFGNVTELIVSMFAIKAGLLRIVQVSLLGSILSNLLLVLGCAFFFGGLRYQQQTFNKTACALNSGMLTLSVMCAIE